MTITWIQAGLLGLMSVCAASTIACLGTTIGNYTLNRPLIASLFVGLILGDVQGCILVAIPMQIIYIALVTPGGTVAADLGAVAYIGVPLAYVLCKGQIDAGTMSSFSDQKVYQLAGGVGALVGTVGTVQFYGTAMFNLVWQHIGWARLDKNDFKIIGKVETVMPLISHFCIRFLPTMFIVYYGSTAVNDFQTALPMDSWYMKGIFTLGSLLPAVGIAILLKSVVDKPTDIVYFVAGFAMAKSMGLTLLAATAIGGVFALVNYNIAMIKANGGAGSAAVDDEEDI